MTKICLTGGIACGKSLVARDLNDFGVATIDADDVVHELIPDAAERRRLAAEVFADPAKRKALEARLHPIVKARIEAFLSRGVSCQGDVSDKEVVSDKGDVSDARGARDARVSSPSRLACPSRRPLGQGGHSIIRLFDYSIIPPLAIIPLLFEAHWDAEYDIICCVASERETQISRMTATRGYTREEAEARLAAQLPVAEKAAKSHYVIHNDSTPDELKEKVKDFLAWLCARLPG